MFRTVLYILLMVVFPNLYITITIVSFFYPDHKYFPHPFSIMAARKEFYCSLNLRHGELFRIVNFFNNPQPMDILP